MSSAVTGHYESGNLRSVLEAALAEVGVAPTVQSLGPVDEFHIGGRPATRDLLAHLDLSADDHVLDVGSGLGGTARLIADSTRGQVTGVDLTPEFVEVAQWLTDLVGLGAKVRFRTASALDLGTAVPASGFDAAVMLHVGMNIADKVALATSIHRALTPGGRFAIYDAMAGPNADTTPIEFPVPWASMPSESHLARPQAYAEALTSAGFEIEVVDDRSERALIALARPPGGSGRQPSPLGLHLVMGPDARAKGANVAAAIKSGAVAPTMIVARRTPTVRT